MSKNSELFIPFGPALYQSYVDESLCDEIINWINSQTEPDHMAAFNLTGQVTNEYGIPSGTFPELEKIIKRRVLEYLEGMHKTQRGGDIENLEIKYMWANKMEKYDWNPPHVHSQNFSGVLYLHDWYPQKRHNLYPNKAPGGVTVFHDGRMSPWSRHEFVSYPEKGKMLLFPAWPVHSVGPSWNDANRYTISWNV